MNVYISEAEIKLIVKSLSKQICDIVPKNQEITILCVLKGSAVFTSDLIRALSYYGIKCKLEFIRLSSYNGTKSSGKIVLYGDKISFNSEWILIVEDIIDSGRTLKSLVLSLREILGCENNRDEFLKNGEYFNSMQGLGNIINVNTCQNGGNQGDRNQGDRDQVGGNHGDRDQVGGNHGGGNQGGGNHGDRDHDDRVQRQHKHKHNHKQILSVVLLDKRERREVEFLPDFVGKIIPDVFVVGYGMDYNEIYRELPYIAILDEENPI